jgi:hypothetical protein
VCRRVEHDLAVGVGCQRRHRLEPVADFRGCVTARGHDRREVVDAVVQIERVDHGVRLGSRSRDVGDRSADVVAVKSFGEQQHRLAAVDAAECPQELRHLVRNRREVTSAFCTVRFA